MPTYENYQAVLHDRSEGFFWNQEDGQAATITYSFVTSLPSHYEGVPQFANFFTSQFSAEQVAATSYLLHEVIPYYTNITFLYSGDSQDAQIRLWNGPVKASVFNKSGFSIDVRPDEVIVTNQDVVIDNAVQGYSVGELGSFVLLHEILHSVGLADSTLPRQERFVRFSAMGVIFSSPSRPSASTASAGRCA